MATKKTPTPELIQCANLADELARAIESVTLLCGPNANKAIVDDLTLQLKNSANEARAISKRLRRMQTLDDNATGQYLMTMPDGTIRPATPDEVLRQVMHYPPAGTDILALICLAKENPKALKDVFREE